MPAPNPAHKLLAVLARGRAAAHSRWPGPLGDAVADLLAINVTEQGRVDRDPRPLVALATAIHQLPTTPSVPRPTQGELAALALMADGLTTRQIAAALDTTEAAVRWRLGRAYRTLGARSGPHAVAIAIRWGLLVAAPERRAS